MDSEIMNGTFTTFSPEYNMTETESESLILSTIKPTETTKYDDLSTSSTTVTSILNNSITSSIQLVNYLTSTSATTTTTATTTQLPIFEDTTESYTVRTDGPEFYQGTDRHPEPLPNDHHHQHHAPFVPGRMEAIVIIAIVCTLLFLAAKYVGCKISYCPCYKTCAKCCKSDSPYHTRPVRFHNSRNHHMDATRYQQEYNTGSSYSSGRPQTAYGMHVAGYTYGNDNCVILNEENVRYEKEKTDSPPEYDAIVPPSYSISAGRQFYSYSASRRHV